MKKNVFFLLTAVAIMSVACKESDREKPPTLTTAKACEVTTTTATLGGDIIDAGTPAYTERGVCYATTANPTTVNNKTPVAGTDLGSFSVGVSGLTPFTIYYMRAYAVHATGTVYGGGVTFRTTEAIQGIPPSLTTAEASNLTRSGATLGGNITDAGTPAYMERGVCYAATTNPTIANNKRSVWGTGTGDFSIYIDGLEVNQTYYAKAYTISQSGTTYGAQVSFTLTRLPKVFDMPFQATTLDEAQAWQNEAREKLLGYVEVFCPRKSVAELPLDVKIESTEERDSYTKHRITYMGNEGERKTAILTTPKGKGDGPFPAILALHGHGGNEDAVFDPNGIYKGFADDFARGGYVVLAPSLEHRKYAGMQLWNLIRLVDILETIPEADKERLGVAGLSMGGEWTMWVAACDLRLKAAVVSGWMCTHEGCLAVPNCECWELPGFFTLMDVCEINILMAPRPVVFESSLYDDCFPIKYCREGFARIREGYGVFGAKDDVAQDTWDAGHEWHGELAYPMMDRSLKGNVISVYLEKKHNN